MSDFKGKK